ncbi:MAG: hypothetical protein HQ457_10780 [Betaproteobacteria bacterium]|nr:hypothetical protein [Betaproteobacteria bacterium]
MHNFNSHIPKELDQWLNDVREGAGFFSIGKPHVWRDFYFQDKAELIKLIQRYQDECNIYVSMGTFPDKTTGRKKIGVKSLCSMWLDIDSHGGGKYSSPDDALKDFLSFIKNFSMPMPSYINMSGHGIQVFWCSQHRLSPDEWLKDALMLRAIAESFGLDVDGEVTTDTARVMRIPMTNNFRDPKNPVQGRFVEEVSHV